MLRAAIAVALLLAAPPALAQVGHEGMACTTCHTGRPSGKDLRGGSVTQVCLRCHDGTTATDVLGAARALGGAAAAFGRSAGALNQMGDADAAGYAEIDGHTLGSTAPPPGFTGSWPTSPLSCTSCHAAHPNGNYRQLGPDPFNRDPAYVSSMASLFPPSALPSYAVVEPGAPPAHGADVYVTRDAAGVRYDVAGVRFATNAGRNAMNAFCAACHGAMHGQSNTVAGGGGDADGTAAYVRHPTSGVPLLGRTRATFTRQQEPLRAAWREDGTPEVSCLSCHRAHGTRHPFGLVHWDGAKPNGEDGAGTEIEGTCTSCHSFDD